MRGRTQPRRVVELRTFRSILETRDVRGLNVRTEVFVRRGRLVRGLKVDRGRKIEDLFSVVPRGGTKRESLISVWYEGGKCLE